MYSMDVMDDLFDAADNPTAMDLADGFEEFDAYEEGFNAYDAGDAYDAAGAYDAADAADAYADGFDAYDAYTDYGEEYDSDSLDDLVADALDAEDTEEFLRRIRRIASRAASVARSVGRGVGQAARVVAPIASAIPLPQAQAIGRIAGIAGRLLADGADDFELLDNLFDLAEAEGDIDAATPVIAGLTVRTIMPGTTHAARPVRRQVVRSVTQATRTLVQRQGTPAARAIPQVVRTAQRTAAQRRLPNRQLPQTIRSTAARVAANPQLTRRMTQEAARRPSPARDRGRRLGTAPESLQRYNISGPVEIIIRRR